jgi:hypothetical protein
MYEQMGISVSIPQKITKGRHRFLLGNSRRRKEVSPPELLGRAQVWVIRGLGVISALPFPQTGSARLSDEMSGRVTRRECPCLANAEKVRSAKEGLGGV